MSFYSTPNQKNFFVKDPFIRVYDEISSLQNDISSLSGAVNNLNTTIDSLFFANGPTLFLNQTKNDYQIEEFENFFQILNDIYTISSNPSLDQQSTSFPIQPNGHVLIPFATNPQQNMFSTYLNNGSWRTHLFYTTSSSHLTFDIQIFQIVQINGSYNTQLVSTSNPLSISPSIYPSEQTFLNQINNTFSYSPTTQYFFFIAVYNDSSLLSNIDFFYGIPTPSRIETNLISIPLPKTFSWSFGYFDGLPNPIDGQFFITSEDTNPPMYSINDNLLIINTNDITGGDLYNWFNIYHQTPSTIQISNPADPSDFFTGVVTNFTQSNSTPNPFTLYKGFNYIYERDFGNAPSINHLVIFSMTGVNDLLLTNSNNIYADNFTFNSNPEILLYVTLYSSLNTPIDNLTPIFKSIVDTIIYDSTGTINDINSMKTQFSSFTGPSDLYNNFEFLSYTNLPSSSPTGLNFAPNIAFGRNYFPSSSPISNEGTGYHTGDACTVLGTDLGGISPDNDCFIIINDVNIYGGVTDYSATGVANYLQGQNSILNGGSNQYDTGNSLNNSFVDNINYGTGTIQYDIFGTGSNMFIDYNNSIFIMAVTNAQNNYIFSTTGSLGSNGNTDIGNTNTTFQIETDTGLNYGISGYLKSGQIYNFTFSPSLGGFTMKKPLKQRSLKPQKTITNSCQLDSIGRPLTTTKTIKRNFNLKSHKIEHLNLMSFTKTKLASTIDLRSRMQPIQDQGDMGSCTAFATTALYGFLNPAYKPSQLFLYYNARYLDYIQGDNSPSIDDGSTVYQSVISSQKYGICNSSLWPYLDTNLPKKPNTACYTNALNHQTINYKNVKQTTDDMKTCLNNGFPFMFGFLVYSSFISKSVSKTGIVPMPSRREQVLGGHAVACVGYNDATQYFICRNSWGTSWGDKGYFYLPYNYLKNKNLSSDLWMISSIETTTNNL